MQKKIIALAVAGLVSGAAFAQTSVTLSGTVDLGYSTGKDSYKADGYKSENKYSNFRGGDQGAQPGANSSQLRITVTEDLGSGLKAGYYQEIGLVHFPTAGGNSVGVSTGVDTTNGPFTRNRQSFAYVESANLGRLSIGYMNLLADDISGSVGQSGMNRNVAGLAYNSAFSFRPGTGVSASIDPTTFTGVSATDMSRASVFQYSSPVFSGFQVLGQYGQGKSNVDEENVVATSAGNETDANYRIYNIALKYNNGPLALAGIWQRFKTDVDNNVLNAAGTAYTTNTSRSMARTEWNLAGSYDFGVAKVQADYFNRKSDITNDVLTTPVFGDVTYKYRGADLSVIVPIGQFSVYGSYGFAKASYDGEANGVNLIDAEWKVRAYQLGARYELSKRTSVYAYYGRATADGGKDASGEDGKRSVLGGGLRHTF